MTRLSPPAMLEWTWAAPMRIDPAAATWIRRIRRTSGMRRGGGWRQRILASSLRFALPPFQTRTMAAE